MDVYDKNGKVSSSKLKRLSLIDEQYIYEITRSWPQDSGLIERLYAIKSGLVEPPKCKCGNKKTFNRGRYASTCGDRKCAALYNRPAEKISTSMLSRGEDCKAFILASWIAGRWNPYSFDECLEYYELNCIGARWSFDYIHTDFICNLWVRTNEIGNWDVKHLIKICTIAKKHDINNS